MSAQISSVVQYSTVIYLLFITSFTKKYITLMCLVFLKIDLFPFIIRSMVMRLYWNMMLLSTVYPCAWIKHDVHNTGPIISLTPMIQLSIQIRPLIFCCHDPLVIATDHREIMLQVCPRQSLCMENDASTHHFITERLSALRFSLTPNVPLMYFLTCFRSPQSSSSGTFTLVVRKSTSFSKSQCNCPLMYKCCDTTGWNCAN